MEIIMKDWIQPATSVKMGDTWRFYLWGSLVAQVVKNLPAVQETQVQSLGQEDPREKGMAIHSSILAWKILWTEEPCGPQPMGSEESDMT